MNEINIARKLISARHVKKITQKELASYIGVSKAAVSKWESGVSFPDITILPQLAAYFNMTIDELIGYEPQMSKDQIRKTYHELKKIFAEKSWDEAMDMCQKLEKKYYSCFPFLLQLVILYINHATLCKEPRDVYAHCIELAERIHTMSEDVYDAREAAILEAVCYLFLGEPMKALDLTDERLRPISQEAELLAQIYQNIGNVSKSKEVYQICIYQHLISLIGDSVAMFLLYANDLPRADEIIHRTLKVMDIFHIERLNSNTAATFYLSAAQVYSMNQQMEQCLEMLKKYVYICENFFFPCILHGDDFFDQIDGWFQEFDIGDKAPRSETLIRKSMLETVHNNPAFVGLTENTEFKVLLKRLKKIATL